MREVQERHALANSASSHDLSRVKDVLFDFASQSKILIDRADLDARRFPDASSEMVSARAFSQDLSAYLKLRWEASYISLLVKSSIVREGTRRFQPFEYDIEVDRLTLAVLLGPSRVVPSSSCSSSPSSQLLS